VESSRQWDDGDYLSLLNDVTMIGNASENWDVDGDVTWLASSPKLLSIESDVEADGFVFNLLGSGYDQRVECPASSTGSSFIDLSELGAGDYQLHVIAHISSASDQLVTGSICISVLPDEEIVLDKELAQGFTVLQSPSLPSLEQLWNGSATLDVYDPVSKSIVCQLDFHSDTGAKQSFKKWSGKGLTLPITSDEWQAYIDSAKSNKQVRSAYELSASASIHFRSIELGQTTLHFEREFVTFKCLLRERNGSYRLQLIQNDTSERVDVLYFDFAYPNLLQPQAVSADGEVAVPKSGCLRAATCSCVTCEPTALRGASTLPQNTLTLANPGQRIPALS
jgi:hypothetical protein